MDTELFAASLVCDCSVPSQETGQPGPTNPLAKGGPALPTSQNPLIRILDEIRELTARGHSRDIAVTTIENKLLLMSKTLERIEHAVDGENPVGTRLAILDERLSVQGGQLSRIESNRQEEARIQAASAKQARLAMLGLAVTAMITVVGIVVAALK